MSTRRFAHRAERVCLSPSLSAIADVRRLRASGLDVIDFGRQKNVPTVACEAASRIMNTPIAAVYSDPRGTEALRRAIAAKLAADNEIVADPNTEIVVTVGSKQGILMAVLALVGEGDEVLLEDPGWVSLQPIVHIAGATPVAVPMIAANDGFRTNLGALRARITSRTRLLILCNPHNPTGRCLSRDDLDGIARLAREHDLIVLVDEAYEHFTYDGTDHISLAALPGMADRTVTAQTVSKIYNMGGWRVGWLAAPKDIADRILALHSHSVTCAATFAQAGVEAALNAGVGEGDQPLKDIVTRYERQRDTMVRRLSHIAGLRCHSPQDGYFVFPDIRRFGMTSAQMAHYLLEEARVASVPGTAFGAAGEGYLRLVFKSDVEEIIRGVDRIAGALARLKPTEE